MTDPNTALPGDGYDGAGHSKPGINVSDELVQAIAREQWWPHHSSRTRAIALAELDIGSIGEVRMEYEDICNIIKVAILIERERCADAISSRKAIYQFKKDQEDIFDKPSYSRWDAMDHTIQAYAHLESDLGLDISGTDDDD